LSVPIVRLEVARMHVSAREAMLVFAALAAVAIAGPVRSVTQPALATRVPITP
jgi:hypothetical protein